MLQLRAPALVCVVAVASLVSAAPAFGDAPIPLPPNPDVSYAAGEICPFPVRVAATANRSLLHVQRSGELIVTGKLTQRATNLSTGKSLDIKSNGPLRVIPHDDGSATLISHGSIFWTFFAQDVGGPGLFVFTGRVVMESGADGFATSVSRPPKVLDVCQALA